VVVVVVVEMRNLQNKIVIVTLQDS
jgi:hypothetical protein